MDKRLGSLLIRFCVVGGVCSLIDYGILAISVELLKLSYLFSAGVAFSVSVVLNFILSTRFVFKGKHYFSSFFFFIILSLFGLVLNQAIIWFAVERLDSHYLWGQVEATFIVMVYNFLSRKFILGKNN